VGGAALYSRSYLASSDSELKFRHQQGPHLRIGGYDFRISTFFIAGYVFIQEAHGFAVGTAYRLTKVQVFT